MTIVKSSGIPCKGNVNGDFEMLPSSLFNYIELGLITQNDYVIYSKLLKLYNTDYGYAYPTIQQLMVFTGIKSNGTIISGLKRLVEAGLLAKTSGTRGNNIYVVLLPLEKEELYIAVPEKVKILEGKISKLMAIAESDKERLQKFLLSKQEEESEIQAKEVGPKLL